MDFVTIEFRSIMVLLAILNFFLAFFAESVIVDYIVFIKLKEWLKNRTSAQTLYDKIWNQTKTTDWLPRPDDDQIVFDSQDDKSGDQYIDSCQYHGSVRFSNQKLNGYTNNGLVGDDDNGTIKSNHDEHGTKTETIIEINNQMRSKSSPSESGICVLSPVSAPVSPGSRFDTFCYDGSDPLAAATISKPIYKSISNIPFDTNDQVINLIDDVHGSSSSDFNLNGHNNHGKHNQGFIGNEPSLILIDNQETLDEDSDVKPVLNGNSSDVLI